VASAIVVFTRDLRVRDHPALATACRTADDVIPLFVVDEGIRHSMFFRPNRVRFLVDSLLDLDATLRDRGGSLIVRRGDWGDEILAVANETHATTIHVSDDVSAYARSRLAALESAATPLRLAVQRHEGLTVVPPGALTPVDADHYRVFTPYHRRWLDEHWRAPVEAPDRITLSGDVAGLPLSQLEAIVPGTTSASLPRGGEREARRRLNSWTRSRLAGYEASHDDLAGDATSHVSADLHFGCISPLEIATRLRDRTGGDAYVRQLCWRDFFHQVLAARPDAAWRDYRTRHDAWHVDPDAFGAWRAGLTGFPIVDAAMRQLQREGFVHNRARMIVASFLTKDLYIDWRSGARHFLDWLVDGDIANNNLNWQWTAGTGTDSNPHRVFNPTRQSERFDPDGRYIRRYVSELAPVAGRAIHDPDEATRRSCGYPPPIVDHQEAIAAYKARFSAR
jgi:deoxyribodipyrimidine photo-lyase